jgi:amidase
MSRGALEAGEWRDRGLLRSLAAMTAYASFAPAWNFTGQPAACVPAGLDAAGLPTAVQLVAPQYGELELLALAAQLEQARPWAHHRPQLADPVPAAV